MHFIMVQLLKVLCCSAEKADKGATPSRYIDFDANAERGEKEIGNSSNLPSSTSFKIIVREDPDQDDPNQPPPPAYSLTEQPMSVQRTLAVYQAALEHGKEHGILGAFNTLRHRHLHVWMDDNFKLAAVTKESIRVCALHLLLLGRAMDCDMEFFFMSQSNTDSDQLTDQERERARALDEVWNAQNLGDATNLINASPMLQSMGLLEWLQYNETTMETPNERFTQLLSHIRDLKVPLWQGYHQRSISLNNLINGHTPAIRKARKQPKSLNSVRFTFEREISHYHRLKVKKQAELTTVIILTGSPLQPSEANSIITFQKDNALQKTKAAQGQGSDFSIQTVVWTENMEDSAVESLRKIDNAFKGDNDINDLTEVHDTKLLKRGPTATLFYKILNSHDNRVDNMQIRKDIDMYGKTEMVPPLEMPTFKDVAKVLGQDEDKE